MSKEFIFDCNLRLKAVINDSFLDEIDEDSAEFVTMELIQGFLKELVKHPEAVLKYYRNVLVETVLNNDYEDYEIIQDKLEYQFEPNELFMGIAGKCPEDIKTFITKLYTDKGSQVTGGRKNTNEFFRETLEDHFQPLRVSDLSFIFMSENSSQVKNDENS